jgi:hypothetical protein
MENSKTFNYPGKIKGSERTKCARVSVDEINAFLVRISPERHAELDAKLAWLRGKARSA